MGFEEARRLFFTPMLEELEQVGDSIGEMQRMELGGDTSTNLNMLASTVDAYEATLLKMNDYMESRGYSESGEIGQAHEALAELQNELEQANLASLEVTLRWIGQYESDFFLRSDLAAARLVHEMTNRLREQIANFDDRQLSPEVKARLNTSLDRYTDHFLAASSDHLKLRDSRVLLIGQSDLANTLTSQLIERQQAEFNSTVGQLQLQRARTVRIIIGLTVLTLLVSASIAYLIVGQIIGPVQALGEASDRLGAGELGVRATVYGRDEIGTTAAAFNLMADRLQELLSSLEQQVADRQGETGPHQQQQPALFPQRPPF